MGARRERAWALSVVPHFSSPPASRLSRVGWFSRALVFRPLYYPWGKMGTTRCLYLGPQSNQISKRLKSCTIYYQFYSCVDLKILFQNTCRIKSFLNRSQRLNVMFKACCWNCNDFYITITKRRLHDRKTEHSTLNFPNKKIITP